MVLFVFTKPGWLEMEEPIRAGNPVWVNDGVLTHEELTSYRTAGVNLTTFSTRVDPEDDAALREALCTIAEHHPGERLWIEWAL